MRRGTTSPKRWQWAKLIMVGMSLAMHMLTRHQDRSLQTLMVEAFNYVLRKHGKSPVGISHQALCRKAVENRRVTREGFEWLILCRGEMP